MTQTIDLKQLSPAQLKELRRDLEQETANSKRKREGDIAALKGLIDEVVNSLAPELADFQTVQNLTVDKAFLAFESVLALKKEIYDYKDNQASHTFSSRDGMASITIGFNEIIGFDGTETAGVIKIREFLTSMSGEDETREKMERLLNTFMKPDKKGNLNPTRITELVSEKEAMGSKLFSDGVDIIVNAQFKTRTSQFVRGWYKRQGENGKELKLSFSITASS